MWSDVGVENLRPDYAHGTHGRHDYLVPGNYRALSYATGVSRVHVSRFLRGECGASWCVAVKIADMAGVSLDELRTHIDSYRQVEVEVEGKSVRGQA